jgi:hypothetical protein
MAGIARKSGSADCMTDIDPRAASTRIWNSIFDKAHKGFMFHFLLGLSPAVEFSSGTRIVG